MLLITGGIEVNPGSSNIVNNNKPIRITRNNVCSLVNKIDIVYSELSTSEILAITETHLDNCKNEDVKLSGFHPPLRKDRNSYGRGVALYASNKLHIKERNDI